MELDKYIPRNERIMLTCFGYIDKFSPFYKNLSDKAYFDSDYSVDFLLNPPPGIDFDVSNWKEIDHYAVLGLKNVRWRATFDRIKNCYRQRLLQFHPDKKRSIEESKLSNLTSCLNKSFDVLGNSVKRRSYDSVDPFNDDDIPVPTEVKSEDFYLTYSRAFEKNSRWSNIQPVPKFGDLNSSYKEITTFYNFWYSFDSWREFSYLDKEDKEQGENRYQRRAIDKDNKAERTANKKRETARIRKLVDDAYARDIRVKNFQQQQRKDRQELKKSKKEQQRTQSTRIEYSLLTTSSVERAEDHIKRFQSERSTLLQNIKNIDCPNNIKLCEFFNKLTLDSARVNLAKLTKVNKAYSEGKEDEFREGLYSEFEECQALLNGTNGKVEKWTVEALQCLSKATKVFPQGYKDRWQHITRNVNSKGYDYSIKEVMRMSKDLMSLGDSNEFLKKFNSQKNLEVGKTENVNWSAEEQAILEQALKTYPASTEDRWEKVAACLVGRSKNDCITRCKEIIKRLNSKK